MEETLTSQKMAKIDLINSLEKISSEVTVAQQLIQLKQIQKKK